MKPVGTPVIELLARVQLLDRVEARLRQIAQRDEAVADLVVGDREDRVLGLVEDDVGVFLAPRRRSARILFAEKIRFRRVAFSLMIRA